MKATIIQTSTPNPFANLDMEVGQESSGFTAGGNIVRFVITQDKMQVVDMRETSTNPVIDQQQTRTPSVVNAWPITNVDLKYRVNLDGEKTNFYEENQELDWQVRQWVKVNFDKNDLSDVAALGPFQSTFLSKCGDESNSSATLVPNSFVVDETNNYMQWVVSVTVPVKLDDMDCNQAYGNTLGDFVRMNRSNVTFNMMYSLTRATPVGTDGYVPFAIDEKDPIRHKYGTLQNTVFNRDDGTGLIAATQYVLRYNPTKPITWYFAPGYPDIQQEIAKTGLWTRPGGIVEQTNAVFQKAGATAQLQVLNYNDASALGDAAGPTRQFGDIRYSFIRWATDLDTDSPFLAATQFQPDPRTGELISASINFAAFPIKEFLEARIDAYLEKWVNADPFADPPPDPTDPSKQLPATCNPGDAIPILPSTNNKNATTVNANIYSGSSLFQRMAQYLPAPPDGASPAGPSDYVYAHTGDAGKTFYSSYYALIPYTTYADPLMNQFVTPPDGQLPSGMSALLNTLTGERQFQQNFDAMEHGTGGLRGVQIETSAQGMLAAYNAIDHDRQLLQAHRDYVATWQLPHSLMRADTTDLISFPATMARSARPCVNGKWMSKADWETALLNSYNEQTIWHEFGHVLGLEHNFMGSVDKANWPTYTDGANNTQYGKFTSSVMEYAQSADDVFWNNGKAGQTGWLPYDQGAIAFVYGNNLTAGNAGPKPATPGNGQQVGASGQVSATAPWNDPYGWNGNTEKNYLFCSHEHIRYTPLCRPFDLGSTPSEITAPDIESYEWYYQWRNFRKYLKVWDNTTYAARIANVINDTRRFMSMMAWDWSNGELTDKLIQVGINPPTGAANAQLFYQQLTSQFDSDANAALELVAAFHEAIVQQSTGQRPYQTQYDPYFGDVTQQGISIDKEFAIINWLGIWPFDNFDPTQSNGFDFSSMVIGPGVTGPQQAWSTAGSMLGEKGAWDAFPEFFPSAIALYGHDTQGVVFNTFGYPNMREWIGGHTFTRQQDALDFFKQVAADNPAGPSGCADFETCTYNPMTPQTGPGDISHTNPTTQAFIGPDGRRWAWVYLADRNIWFFCDQDRNPSSYYQVLQYNNDVNVNFDDGTGGGAALVFQLSAKMKYMIDAYGVFGGDTTTATN